MNYSGEKINYTTLLKDKPLETDPEKLGTMIARLERAVEDVGVQGEITYLCYADGCVKVFADGKYYNMFDSNTGKFFSGGVGD